MFNDIEHKLILSNYSRYIRGEVTLPNEVDQRSGVVKCNP